MPEVSGAEGDTGQRDNGAFHGVGGTVREYRGGRRAGTAGTVDHGRDNGNGRRTGHHRELPDLIDGRKRHATGHAVEPGRDAYRRQTALPAYPFRPR